MITDYIKEAIELEEDRSDKSAIKSSLRNLILHLLKSKYQKEYENKSSWAGSIEVSYENIVDRFIAIGKGSLYKRFYLKQLSLDEIYENARIKASKETGLSLDSFPEKCEWTKEQLVDPKFIYEFINEFCK